jgi:hypothetical protein
MGYGLDGRGSVPDRGKIFLLFIASRPALKPTQTPKQWVQGALSSRVKQQEVKMKSHLHIVLRSRMVELYLHSSTRLHGVMLNYLSMV